VGTVTTYLDDELIVDIALEGRSPAWGANLALKDDEEMLMW
jgi:hypothetical protein